MRLLREMEINTTNTLTCPKRVTETLPPLRRDVAVIAAVAVAVVVSVVTVLLRNAVVVVVVAASELLLPDVSSTSIGVARIITIEGPAVAGAVWVCARLSDSSSTWRKSC